MNKKYNDMLKKTNTMILKAVCPKTLISLEEAEDLRKNVTGKDTINFVFKKIKYAGDTKEFNLYNPSKKQKAQLEKIKISANEELNPELLTDPSINVALNLLFDVKTNKSKV